MNTDDPAFWVKTDWPSKDLENKSVQFELTAPKMRVSGIGEFLVRTRPNGEQRIEIDVTLPEPYPTMVQRRFICVRFTLT